jgi:mannosyltransferase
MSTSARPRPRAVPWLLQAPAVPDLHAPRWFHRLPPAVRTGGILLVLLAISAVVRSRYITGQYWSDESTAVGIASHSISQIPGLLRQNGTAPLYYLLLHVWMQVFGSGEVATHALSILFGLLTVPVAMWAGWSLFGRRAGYIAATLFAFSAFLTQFAEETGPWELMALLGLVAITCFLYAFVLRRRWVLIPLAVVLALILYTSAWGVFFWLGSAAALIPVYRAAGQRAGLLRDAGLAYAGALILFIPWIPTLIYQIGHTTSPWGYGDKSGFGFPSTLFGSDRVSVSLAIAAAVALPPMFTRRPRPREATMVLALILVPVVAALVARVFTIVSPVWETRYFGATLAGLLLVGALACARSGVIGLIAVILSIAFVANAASFTPKNKSDMRDVAGELAPYLRSGDLVVLGAPEQSSLAWYYLPAGLRFATTMGPVKDPSYMNWENAYTRLEQANPRTTLNALVASLRPGQRLLFARPLSEGVKAWSQSWPMLVRRRAAQWGALIATDPQLRPVPGAIAPHAYPAACCIADSAIVYQKVG